ncbi:UNVERIFIED_CONTAM: hypothetical protein GTU68_032309 [Idotea baltica]|nr:hypothetical protein [Idotea baltica]
MRGVLALILAGGKGSRLDPLTRDRTKPAVPFGGCYRIIDFTLSNCINSGMRQMLVLTQYKAASLDRHINVGWRFLCRELGEFVDVLPPQQRIDEQWYQGTADAVYQNIYSIEQTRPEHILILSGDHIYKMDYSELVGDHIASNADATIACIPSSIQEGREFGVMQVDESQRITSFVEKPENPPPMPGDSSKCLASMGIYVFKAEFLFDQLCKDATSPDSVHDFGKNVIPSIIDQYNVRAFPFRDKNTGDGCYWRDVGTLDSYFEANMDLISIDPQLNLYDRTWPIRTYQASDPPPKFVFADFNGQSRVGQALDSLVSRSIVSPNCRVNSWACVEDSILFEGVTVGRHAHIRRTIIDKGVAIPEGFRIGFDPAEDRANGFSVSESGLVSIGKHDIPTANGSIARPMGLGRVPGKRSVDS